jgi:MFS family permease
MRERHGWPRHFLSTSAITFMLVTGVHILSPVLPVYAERFGVSNVLVGLVVSSYAAGRLLFSLAGGVLADWFGTKQVAVLGLAIVAAASFLAGWTTSYQVLVGARFAQGIGSALYMTATIGLVIDIAPEGHLGRLVALYQGIFMAGLAVGPSVGGALASVLGLRAPFFAYGLMALLSLAASLAWLPSDSRAAVDPAEEGGEAPVSRRGLLVALLRTPAMLLALTATVVVFIVRAGVRSTLLPLFAQQELGLSEVAIGLLLTVVAVGSVMVVAHAGKALDRHGRRPVMRWSLAGTAVAVALFALAGLPWMLVPLALALGASSGYAGVVPPVVVADVAAAEIRTTAIGVQRMATDAGLLVGPVAVGAASDGFGYRFAFVAAGVLVLAAAAAAVWMPETLDRRRGPGTRPKPTSMAA